MRYPTPPPVIYGSMSDKSKIVPWVIAGVMILAAIGGVVYGFQMESVDSSGEDTCHIDRLILRKALIQSYELLTQPRPNVQRTLDVIEHAAYSTGTELP